MGVTGSMMTDKPTTPSKDPNRTHPEGDTLVHADPPGTPGENAAEDRLAEDREIDELLLGRVIEGRFEILELIGHGGFGSVYKARQSSVDRIVAMKILRPHLVGKGILSQRFLLEAKATSRLSNPHTVTVFDHGETDDGLLYIAMEFLPGRTLQDRIDDEGVLPTHDALRIVGEIAESLAEAHAHQIIHRDLKPENILLVDTETAHDFVKVLDFGIARAKTLTGDMTLTSTGQLSGTPPYMSPEVIRGRQVTASADVYSMAIILYQLISGHCPFEGDTPFDIFMAHVQKNPKKLSDLGIKVSRPLETFIQRCLSKDPLTRPQNAGFFLSELRAIADGTAEAGIRTHPAPKETVEDVPSAQPLVQPGAPTLFTDTFNRDVATLRARMAHESVDSASRPWIQWVLALALVALVALGTWFALSSTVKTEGTADPGEVSTETPPGGSAPNKQSAPAPTEASSIPAAPAPQAATLPVAADAPPTPLGPKVTSPAPSPKVPPVTPPGKESAQDTTTTPLPQKAPAPLAEKETEGDAKRAKTRANESPPGSRGSRKKRPESKKKNEVSKIDALLD